VKCSDLHRASLLPTFSDVPWNQLLLAPEASTRVAFQGPRTIANNSIQGSP
jgi:hypothetical protein